jgi:hypothetical protein
MDEQSVKQTTFKISVFKEFPYDDYRKVCDAICTLGYSASITDNGNTVFVKKKYNIDHLGENE